VKKIGAWFLALSLVGASSGCSHLAFWRSAGEKDAAATASTVHDPAAAELDRLKKTESWFKVIEGVRIATQAAKMFAEAAHDAGKIDDQEMAAVMRVKEMVKSSLKIANSELTLYFQNASTAEAVEARIAEMNVLGAQLTTLVNGYKSRQTYEPKTQPAPVASEPIVGGVR
jgi:hypothetical protein